MTTARVTAAAAEPITAAQLTIVPANQASWADLQAIFGTVGYPGKCYCQHFKTRDCDWAARSILERRESLREQARCDDPSARATAGLVAYLGRERPGGEPVGWVAVEPRTAYPRLARVRTVWSGRQEDKADDSVWAVTCFVTRKGYRRGTAGAASPTRWPPRRLTTPGEAGPGLSRRIRWPPSPARRSPGANCTSAAARSSPKPASPR